MIKYFQKILCILLLFVFSPDISHGEDLRIGSFNIQKRTSNECMSFIRTVTEGENFSILAIQEVANIKVCEDISNRLGSGWKFVASKEESGGEYFGFIYKSSKVTLESADQWNDSTVSFKHIPFVALFRSNGKNYSLINVHVEWGSGSIQTRKEDLRKLERVYDAIRHASVDSTVIIMGDFNLTEKEIIAENKTFKCFQTSPTTLNTTGGYANSYDHFCFDPEYLKTIRPSFVRVKAPEKYFKKDFARYRSEVSDHVPIRMDIPDSSSGGGGFFKQLFGKDK